MRRITLAVVLAGAAALAPAARAAGPAENDPGLTHVGAGIFRQYCAACHGAGGTGDGPVASALKKPPADLTRIAARRGGAFPDAEIARFVDGRFDLAAHGTREMPVWGFVFAASTRPGLDPDEVARGQVEALIEYLKTIQQK